MDEKAIDLFKAYAESLLPREGGYIVTSFFHENSAYAKYEIVAYSGMKSVYQADEGLVFQTDGNKLFVIAEPADYERRELEPYMRDDRHQVPHLFSELDQVTAQNQTRILVSRQPVSTYSSFVIPRPTGLNFSMLFYRLPDVLDSIAAFMQKSLTEKANVPAGDAAEAARRIAAGLKKFTIFQELVSQGPPAPPAAAVPPAPAAKPAIVKPAAKPVVAKPAARKKPAAKKPAVKKVPKKVAKKPAKKAPAKKKAPARKKPVKKAAAKKPAPKPKAAKKPVKKAAKKPAKKPAAKKAVKKPAAKAARKRK